LAVATILGHLRAGDSYRLTGWRIFTPRLRIESRTVGYDIERSFIEMIARDRRSGMTLKICAETPFT